MSIMAAILLPALIVFTLLSSVFARVDKWNEVACDEVYYPENCDFEKLDPLYVDDYDRCAPANLSLRARNYFLGAAGRRYTYQRNKDAYDEIEISPKLLRDISKNSLETTILGLKLDFPIGLSPVASHKLVHPRGELETVAGISSMRTIMIVSSDSNTYYEDIVASNKNPPYYLWMQMYIHPNRTVTRDMVKRAEKNGFKGIVVTCDLPILSTISCNSRKIHKDPNWIGSVNLLLYGRQMPFSPSGTVEDIKWLKSITKLPIIAKGILSGEDAERVIKAGVSAILVSNHGGRQLDGDSATIEALPRVVKVAKKFRKDVFVDGGIRSGQDIYKALARGAKMVFVGRPIIWGLTMGGADGVKNVLSILRDQFNETMLVAGSSRPTDIRADTVIPNVYDHKK